MSFIIRHSAFRNRLWPGFAPPSDKIVGRRKRERHNGLWPRSDKQLNERSFADGRAVIRRQPSALASAKSATPRPFPAPEYH